MISSLGQRPTHPSYFTRPVQKIVTAQAVKSLDILKTELSSESYFIGPISPNPVIIKNPMKALLTKVLAQQEDLVPRSQIHQAVKLHRKYILNSRVRATDTQQLRRLFRRNSKGSAAFDLDLLAALVAIAADDSDLRDLGYTEDNLLDFTSHHERLLQASASIHEEVLAQIAFGADGIELKALYEEVVVKTTSVLQALRQLGQRGNMQTIVERKAFLHNAAAADLSAIDIGADKVHLMLILQELKGLRIFNMLASDIENLEQKRLKQIQPELFQRTLDLVEEPYQTMPILERWLAACTTEEQILFFQDYRKMYQMIPEEAYVNDEQKINTKRVLQDRIDELIYNEE